MTFDHKSGPKLSALVVAHNEEVNLPACLASVAFADEIVVVLDRCTDRSREIALAAGARIVEGAWPIEGPRRHAGIEACAGPWILEVDADERVPQALAGEIRARLPDAPPGSFTIPFHNYVGGRLVRYGWGAYNGVAAKNCLFTKGTKVWGPQRVHPAVKFTGVRGELINAMEHQVDADIADLFDRINRDSSKGAQDLVDENRVPTAWRSGRRFFTRFWKSYVSRRGHREGYYGVALALAAACFPVLCYLKAREIADRVKRSAQTQAGAP